MGHRLRESLKFLLYDIRDQVGREYAGKEQVILFLLQMTLLLYDNIKNTNRKKIHVTPAAAENCGNIVIMSM